jgi:HEAT repeat protein
MADKEEKDAQLDVAAAIKALSKSSKRQEALDQLVDAGAVEAVEPMLALCAEVKRKARKAIADALGRMGEAAIAPLVAVGLPHKNKRVRRCAIEALAKMGPAAQDACDALLARLDDSSKGVRLAAIEALGEIGPAARVAEPLCVLLGVKSDRVREAAAEALGALGEDVLPVVDRCYAEAESSYVRSAAVTAWTEIGGPEAVARLRAAFADPQTPKSLRIAILSALDDLLEEDVTPLLAEALAGGEKEVRRCAVRCLREIETPGATALLVSLVADEDKKARSLAVRALRSRYEALLDQLRAGDATVMPALHVVWQAMGEKRAAQAAAIADALVEMGPPLVPVLAGALHPETPGAELIGVLARMGPQAVDAYGALVAQLDHPDNGTACAAARALGALGDERAIPVLAARLAFDPALLKAKGHDGKQARRHAQALQRAAAEGLGALGRTALPAALDAARSGDTVERVGGLLALGYIGGGRALATLERAVADGDEWVREAAAEAMERAAAEDVIRLGRMVENEDAKVRAKAVSALGKLDDLRSLDLLLRAYGDPSERVSQAAVVALAGREGERAASMLIASAAGGNTTAIRTLAAHPTPAAIPALIEALDSPWYEVYSEALLAIDAYADALGDDPLAMEALHGAIPELVYLLHDDMAKTRRLALNVLGDLGDASAESEVAHLVLDEKAVVQREAAQVLAKLGSAGASALFKEKLAQIADEDLAETLEEVWAEATGEDL